MTISPPSSYLAPRRTVYGMAPQRPTISSEFNTMAVLMVTLAQARYTCCLCYYASPSSTKVHSSHLVRISTHDLLAAAIHRLETRLRTSRMTAVMASLRISND